VQVDANLRFPTGEPDPEPEVDLSSFLERQRLSTTTTTLVDHDLDSDVDHTIAHISSRRTASSTQKKGKVVQIERDQELEDMIKEKEGADAARELKARFRAKAERLKGTTHSTVRSDRSKGRSISPCFLDQDIISTLGRTVVDAPSLPINPDNPPVPKDPKGAMQDFLDDLLN
jgi:hypothetical protein